MTHFKPGKLSTLLITVFLIALIGLELPRLYGLAVWNSLGVSIAKSSASREATCPPFYNSANACVSAVKQFFPQLQHVAWETGWQYLRNSDFDRAAASVIVHCSNEYVPNSEGRRAEYLLVELLALAKQGCTSNADRLWDWIGREAPYRWPMALQQPMLRSGATAMEWLAEQDQVLAQHREFVAAELWWIANDHAKAAERMSNITKSPHNDPLVPDLRGWANWYLGSYAEELGDLASAQAYYAQAINEAPQLIEANLGQRAVSLALGDKGTAQSAVERLAKTKPEYVMPFGGVPFGKDHVLIGYDLQEEATVGAWLRMIVYWRVNSNTNGLLTTSLCLQTLHTLDLSQYDRLGQNVHLLLTPGPTSSFKPVSISRLFDRSPDPQTQYVLYGLRSSTLDADATITVRPRAGKDYHFDDLNQPLATIAESGNQAADNSVYATYAVALPGEADQAEVLITLHHALTVVAFDRMLVVQIPDPENNFAACVNPVH